MATSKKEIWENVQNILTVNKVKEEVLEALRPLLEPKAGGAKVDVESVVERDGDDIISMVCSLSGIMLPATEEYFYADKAGDGFAGTGLKRLSIQAEKARKDHTKTVKATKDAIKDDLYAGEIDVETAKKLEADIPGVDYSKVGILPEAPEGEDEAA